MARAVLVLVFFLFSSAAADAYTDAGGRYTLGPDGYGGIGAFAEWGNDDYYLRPSLSTYKSDLAASKTTYALGGGLERGPWSAGAEVSATPETDGYRNTGIFADLAYNLLSAPAEDAALQDATLGVFAGLTAHEDSYAASTTTTPSGRGRGTGSAVALTDTFKLRQTDYGVSAGVKLWGLRASVRFTKTAYDKDVTVEARQLPVDIGGIGTSGFPDTSLSARLRIPGLPVAPEAGYARTTYLLDQPDSETVSLGLSAAAGPADISAGWERFAPGGGAESSDYYSFGLTFKF